MNERILELAEQAGFQSIVRGDHIVFDISTKENLKEFAELIVRECANFVDEAIGDGGIDGRSLKEHFGVK